MRLNDLERRASCDQRQEVRHEPDEFIDWLGRIQVAVGVGPEAERLELAVVGFGQVPIDCVEVDMAIQRRREVRSQLISGEVDGHSELPFLVSQSWRQASFLKLLANQVESAYDLLRDAEPAFVSPRLSPGG